MSLIGVGSHVDPEELKHIASSERNVFSVYDYSSLHKLRDVISRRTCVGKHHVSLHTHQSHHTSKPYINMTSFDGEHKCALCIFALVGRYM